MGIYEARTQTEITLKQAIRDLAIDAGSSEIVTAEYFQSIFVQCGRIDGFDWRSFYFVGDVEESVGGVNHRCKGLAHVIQVGLEMPAVIDKKRNILDWDHIIIIDGPKEFHEHQIGELRLNKYVMGRLLKLEGIPSPRHWFYDSASDPDSTSSVRQNQTDLRYPGYDQHQFESDVLKTKPSPSSEKNSRLKQKANENLFSEMNRFENKFYGRGNKVITRREAIVRMINLARENVGDRISGDPPKVSGSSRDLFHFLEAYFPWLIKNITAETLRRNLTRGTGDDRDPIIEFDNSSDPDFWKECFIDEIAAREPRNR